MTATIFILPTVPVVRTAELVPMGLRVSRRQYNRLLRHARKRSMAVEQLALIAIDTFLKQQAGVETPCD